ncbi:MAG: metal-sensitive transcriptional regulator [Proteobacteria bacterium]|nr:metal-sensitive transcriptional regulator [Pseudomonadota bacterium]
MSKHPSHIKKVPNINRAIGQLEAVKRMIESENYCIDILTQLRAARNAIKSIELGVLEVHMRACLRRSLHDSVEQQELKLAEIVNLLKKYE